MGCPSAVNSTLAGFEIRMNQPACMGELQGFGKAHSEPANRVGVGYSGQVLVSRPMNRDRNRCRALGLSQHFQNALSGTLTGRLLLDDGEKVGQSGSTEVGHAEACRAAIGIILHRVQGHDEGVLQAGQRQVFLALARRQFQDHRPLAQRHLIRQKNAALPAASQFRE